MTTSNKVVPIDHITESFSNSGDFLSELYKIASACIDYSFIMSRNSAEVYPKLRAGLNEYVRTIPCDKYFVHSVLKDKILGSVINDPVMFFYFRTMDHSFIQKIQSKMDMSYEAIVDKLLLYIKPLYSTPRADSVLNDKQYIEQVVDLDAAAYILKKNTILFTIYCFKMAFVFSQVFDIESL